MLSDFEILQHGPGQEDAPWPYEAQLYFARKIEEKVRKLWPEQLHAVESAIRDYHFALDSRQHGGVAQDKAFNAICQAMGMEWKQGVEAAARARLGEKDPT